MNKYTPISPEDRPRLSFGYGKMLRKLPGVTVSSAETECVVHPDSVAIDPAPQGRLEDDPEINAAGEIVSQFFSGGLHNVDYILTCNATFSDGQERSINAVQEVRNYNEVGTD